MAMAIHPIPSNTVSSMYPSHLIPSHSKQPPSPSPTQFPSPQLSLGGTHTSPSPVEAPREMSPCCCPCQQDT